MKTIVSWIVPPAYKAMVGIVRVFASLEDDEGIEWIVFRVTGLYGGAGEGEWKKKREGAVYAGPVGGKWTGWLSRSRLARWLGDVLEMEQWDREQKVGKLPAVSDAK